VRVSQEQTLEGRLFQIAGAAERKPRAPNKMLQRVTDRRLAEADRRVLHGVCHWTRLATCGGYRCILLYGSLWHYSLLLSQRFGLISSMKPFQWQGQYTQVMYGPWRVDDAIVAGKRRSLLMAGDDGRLSFSPKCIPLCRVQLC